FPGTAQREVVARVEESPPPVGAAIIGILPVSALAGYEAAAAVESAIIRHRLAPRIGAYKIQAVAHSLPSGYLKRVIVHRGGRVGGGDVGDERDRRVQRAPLIQWLPRADRPGTGQRLI